MYFVVGGSADVEIDGVRANTVGQGDVFGEISLISNQPRLAAVRATTALDVVSVTRETFDALVSHFPGVKAAMNEVMQRHLAPTDAPTQAKREPVA